LLSDPLPQVVVDLHSTSGPGGPFVCISDTLKARELALSLPVPLLLGIEESIRGTLLDHLEREGRTMLLVEGGQHDDPHTPDHLESLIWLILDRLTMLPGPLPALLETGRTRLVATTKDRPRVLEVRHRHEVTPKDHFEMNPGHGNFDRVHEGQPLARSIAGPIVAPESGYLVMPLYQPQGSDGFFIARPIRPAWLRVSTLFRLLRIDRILPRLPGVRPDPLLPLRLEVDPQVARWGTVPLFRLAGFRRLPDRDGKFRFTRRIEP
jgi:succinylglutamate desuccinylase